MVKITPKRIALSAVIAVLLAVAIVASVFTGAYWKYLMGVFGEAKGNTDSTTISNAAALGDDLVQEIAEESMVMLKNENNALPLAEDERKINLFGYGSTENGFVYSGGGSSGTIINKDPIPEDDLKELVVSPVEAFEREGFEVNQELQKIYTDFSTYKASSGRGITTLYQPPASVYTSDVLRNALSFSDIAVVVISRTGSESTDIPLTQSKNNGKGVTDSSRTYLQLTTEEEDMLEVVTDNFDKVIVLLNTASPIEAGFLNDKDIDAAFYVGLTGQSGTLAIPRLLKGYKTVEDEDGNKTEVAVTPSGRLADTYAYSTRQYNPTDANMFAEPHVTYPVDSQISYTEGIYVGYKWYETADAEGYFDNVSNEYGDGYDGVVQYPFGYGLSYGTDFEYTVTTDLPAGSQIGADTKITVTVTVKNSENATASGKEVVQLYFTPEYHEGEIEKSEVNLLAFAKTKTLAPGVSQELTFEIDPYDLACYDDYGRNPGDHTGYELDRGSYTISVRSDAHTLIDCENNEIEYNVPTTVNIDEDPDTGETVENRFTGDDAYMDMPIDGSTAGGDPINYLSRADFAGTYPTERTPDRTDKTAYDEVSHRLNTRYDTDTMPTTEAENGLYLVVKEDGTKASQADLEGSTDAKLKYNDDVILKLGNDYDNEQWNDLLDQLSVSDMTNLCGNGYFKTAALESVGKPQALDLDGPAGFHGGNVDEVRTSWVAFPAESLIGCSWSQEMAFNMGQAQGVIASATGINGWYGPGLNMHRNVYSGRFFEYYSEDPVVIGKLAAEVVRGATNKGLYCYMKHFAVSEEGVNPDFVKTWLTEQTLREVYLKAFEIAVKEGGANAIMTAFNCIGAVWAGACDPMNNDILRGEWGFRGSLITDWSLGNRTYMAGNLGIRGGNDLWLDLNEPFGGSDATTVSLLRTASKNILYTYANTYARAKDYQENGDQDDRYKVELKVEVTQSPFSPIPILMLVGVWALALIGSGVCVVFIVRKPKEKIKS